MTHENIKFLDSAVPEFSIAAAAEIARANFGVVGELKALYSERDQNFRIRRHDGVDFLLKIANSHEDPAVLDMQHKALAHIERQDPELPAPRVIPTQDGETICQVEGPGGASHAVRLLSYLPGMVIEKVEQTPALLRDLGGNVARLGLALRGFYHPAAGHVLLWDLKHAPELRANCQGIADHALRAAVEGVLDHFSDHILPRLDGLRAQIIHNDANGSNVLVHDDDHGRIAGIIDYGDMIHGALIFDLAVAAAGIAHGKDDPLAAICWVAAGYDAVSPLEGEEVDLLYDLVLTRAAVELLIGAWRIANPTGDAADLEGFVAAAGSTFERLRALDRASARARLRAACKFPPYCPAPGEASDDDLDALLDRRRRRLGEKLHTFYKQPLHMVRGQGVWLYDASGRAYLDAYNNVPQVGHAHPHVTRAVTRQSAVLATNTRYVYGQILDYADALAATLPGGDAVCVFVNSGSEANDVAWRMAKTFSGNRGALVMEDAYHGATEATDALSPGDLRGDEIAAHVRTLAAPDRYRGEFREADAGARYAEDADRAIGALQQAGLGVAAFMVDPGFCSNGILDAPDGYLAAVVEKTRSAGGLFIADEVQSGFGRMASHMWGYQALGVAEADIVTLGKPVGNGYPLGVVITRPEILAAFTARTGYFSTFGGNPVACAAGLAVLEVLEREDLLANARDAGDYLRDGIRDLAEQFPLIGDVRGRGLLTGVELVRDRVSLEPAKQESVAVMNHMRQIGVLVGREGYFGNVLKIRPPLVFSRDNADLLIAALGRAVKDAAYTQP